MSINRPQSQTESMTSDELRDHGKYHTECDFDNEEFERKNNAGTKTKAKRTNPRR